MTATNYHYRDGSWRTVPMRSRGVSVLVIAIALHAALLLAPLRRALPPAPDKPLEVELVVERPPVTPAALAQPEPAAAPEPLPSPADPRAPVENSAAMSVNGDVAPKTPPAVTAAVLLEAAARMRWETIGAPAPTPGFAVPGAMPANLTRRILPLTPNRFDGLAAPAETVIVDRWREPDGTTRVVMRTPSGDMLCGSGGAWDPMNPLVETILMYRPCGGGGPRTRRTDHSFQPGG